MRHWKLCLVALLATAMCCCAVADAAPYVSCPGGYIAPTLKDCPIIPKHPVGGPHPGGGGSGGGSGGVLRDLLNGLGLGGIL
jgi:hypothetical protein